MFSDANFDKYAPYGAGTLALLFIVSMVVVFTKLAGGSWLLAILLPFGIAAGFIGIIFVFLTLILGLGYLVRTFIFHK